MSRGHLRALIAEGDEAALIDALHHPIFSSFAGGRDDKGRSLLHDAIDAGMDRAVRALVAAGADTGADRSGVTPLHLAAAQGRTAAAEALLDAGMDVDARTENTNADTALFLAIDAGQAEAAALLLARGANPALKSPDTADGMNGWHRAALAGDVAVLDLLLARADHDNHAAFCAAGRTRADAFRLALRAGNLGTAARLIAHGIDINRRDSEGHTPLHWLILHRQTRAEALPMIRLLLKHGADGDKAANLWGETPLMVSAKADFPEAMKLLLDKGADVTRRSNLHETALHFAARHYTVETIELLLDNGAEIDAPDRTGQTALHIAAHHNRRDVVKTLLARDADPLVKDKRGRLPDELCLSPVQENTRRLVLQAKAGRQKAGPRPVLENGRLRRRFNTPAGSYPRRNIGRVIKKPPSNGGGYRP